MLITSHYNISSLAVQTYTDIMLSYNLNMWNLVWTCRETRHCASFWRNRMVLSEIQGIFIYQNFRVSVHLTSLVRQAARKNGCHVSSRAAMFRPVVRAGSDFGRDDECFSDPSVSPLKSDRCFFSAIRWKFSLGSVSRIFDEQLTLAS